MKYRIRDRGLIKGVTAFALMRLRYRFTTVGLAISLRTLVLNISRVTPSWLISSLGAAMVIAVIPVRVMINWSSVKARAERKAGYTTLRHELNDVEQRDPYQGRVVRRPGGEYLQRTAFLAIIRSAKAVAESLPRPAAVPVAKSSAGGVSNG